MKLPAAIISTFLFAAPLTSITGPAHADDANPPAVDARGNSLLGRAQELVLNALGFMGIPYRWGGAAPETGFDCSGFVQFVFRQATGVLLPRSSFEQIRQGVSVMRDELMPGDLVFFNTMRATASHVGIYIGENRFIHSPSRGKTVEIGDITSGYWQARYDGARRLPL